MGTLPIPAEMFFSDFDSEILEYSVYHNSSLVATYKGLSNSDENGNYIGFLMSDNPQISVGDELKTTDGLDSYLVNDIEYDRYCGKAELMKAYY